MKPINKTINYIEEYLDYEDIRPMIKSKINKHLDNLKSQIQEMQDKINSCTCTIKQIEAPFNEYYEDESENKDV